MSLNWKEIDLCVEELGIDGAFVQQFGQYEFQSIILHLYVSGRACQLLLSTRRDFVRFAFTERKGSREFSRQRFTQLLRSRLRNGKIHNVRQIHSQRIVRFTVDVSDTRYFLYFRMWNNGANIMLTDADHIIIDSLYRRPGSGEISGQTYCPEKEFENSILPDKEYRIRDYSQDQPFLGYVGRYYENAEKNFILDARKTDVKKRIQKELMRLESALKSAMQTRENCIDPEKTRRLGDLILSNIHLCKSGSESLTVADYFNNSETLVIPLDKAKKPAENANAYYRKSKKQAAALDHISGEITEHTACINRLSHLLSSIDGITENSALSEITSNLRQQKVAGKNKEQQVGLSFVSHGFVLLVGRNSRENDYLLRRMAKGNDYWLHVRDCPGGYVFIKNMKDKSIPLDVLLDAGNLAVLFSKARDAESCNLYYTQVKYLRRAKNAKTGTVIPFREKNICIERDENRLNRLLGRQAQGGNNEN